VESSGVVLWTIGYERFPTPEELREVLMARGVERVCDVRAVPRSRRRGFSRRALQDVLADEGILYEHWGERPTALLCLEDDPAACHRGVILEELVARHPGIRWVRL
jgi:uncharacterized protein (DUF488 family)